MLKEALQYLVSLKENKVYDLDGETYSDHPLHRIRAEFDRPDLLEVNGLDSIVKLLQTEGYNTPIFIRVQGPRRVDVFSTLDERLGRDFLYRASCDAPEFHPGWMDHEHTIIALRSMFVPNEDGTEYLLDLLSRISKDDGVQTDDNGVSQTVTARSGVSLKKFEIVKQRIPLAPFRTFTEVDQPTSEFILRLDDNCLIGLLEADGGAWKMEAKQNICAYFAKHLSKEIDEGKVVVML